MNIVLAGTPETSVLVAEALVRAGHTLSAVLSPFPKPIGRKQIITPSALHAWAESRHIPVINVDKEKLASGAEKLFSQPLNIDLLVSADFGFLLPEWILTSPTFGGLNLHPSRLPRWRGATPVPFTLLFGDTDTAITIIRMDPKFDTGHVIAQRDIEVKPTDSTPDLLYRAFAEGAKLLVEILPQYIDGKIQPVPQPKDSPTPLTRRWKKEDGFIPLEVLQKAVVEEQHTLFQQGTTAQASKSSTIPLLEQYHLPQSPVVIERMIRALQPWPKVWTILPNGKRMIIHSAELVQLQPPLLKLSQIQVEGKTIQKLS